MKIRVTSLLCTGCAANLKPTLLTDDALAQLSRSQGKCPNCGNERFRATVTRTMSGYERPSTEDYLLSVALAPYGHSSGPHGHNEVWDDIFALPELQADDLFAHLSQPPEAVSEWIMSFVKEEAKARLRPDQRLCTVCGEIYTIELAGYTREGYCSPLCRKKGLGTSRPPTASAAAPGKVVSCSHCGQPVRPSPGANCMHCGAKVLE